MQCSMPGVLPDCRATAQGPLPAVAGAAADAARLRWFAAPAGSPCCPPPPPCQPASHPPCGAPPVFLGRPRSPTLHYLACWACQRPPTRSPHHCQVCWTGAQRAGGTSWCACLGATATRGAAGAPERRGARRGPSTRRGAGQRHTPRHAQHVRGRGTRRVVHHACGAGRSVHRGALHDVGRAVLGGGPPLARRPEAGSSAW